MYTEKLPVNLNVWLQNDGDILNDIKSSVQIENFWQCFKKYLAI